jgi:hypothetical protein
MKISNHHERVVAATPERVAAIIAGFDGIWPTRIAPAPRRRERRQYDTGLMLWKEFERPGAARAFRVISPQGLQGEHWFELKRVKGGTLLCHVLEGQAVGKCEALWSERIEPLHNRVLEALLDNVAAAVASED